MIPVEAVMASSLGTIELPVDSTSEQKDYIPQSMFHEISPHAAINNLVSTEGYNTSKDIVPDWIDDDNDDDDENDESSVEDFPTSPSTKKEKRPLLQTSLLEQLSPDVSALLLSHFSVQDLFTVALTSWTMYKHFKSNALWKLKFKARWNTSIIGEQKNWCAAYQNAYNNTHDLWMTHWNCVLPMDGESPGRCCIIETAKQEVDPSDDWSRHCPSCRFHSKSILPLIVRKMEEEQAASPNPSDFVYQAEVTATAHEFLLNDPQFKDVAAVTTQSKATFAWTKYSIAKWCYNVQSLSPSSIPSSLSRVKRAKRAFRAASTFYRKIHPNQYMSHSLHFLRDTLFFSTGDSLLSNSIASQTELESMKCELYGNAAHDVTAPGITNTVSHLGPHHESARHSWHIVRFTNPDFCKPLTFRIFIQRQECFTAYPSEGFLEPGETCHVTFGVRLLGSLVTEAYEALNVQREAVDPFLADVYAHEAHLPYVPFSVRYMFAPVVPCIPPAFTSRGGSQQGITRPAMPLVAVSKYKHIIDYLWEHMATEALVRTQFLSAHVNTNYRLEDFQLETLIPFDLTIQSSDQWRQPTASSTALVYVAPNLYDRYPNLFTIISNTKLETEFSDIGVAYRTEKQCQSCFRDWGARSEELGRTFLLRILVCEGYRRQCQQQMDSLVLLIRQSYELVYDDINPPNWRDMYRLLYKLHRHLVQRRATPLQSKRQQQSLKQLESIVDEMCVFAHKKLSQLKEFLKEEHLEDIPEFIGPLFPRAPWRGAGVYHHRLCTDSIFNRDAAMNSSNLVDESRHKDERVDMDGFRHLCHGPGSYCLGQQQDPNHPHTEPNFDVSTAGLRSPFFPKERAPDTDIFMDDTVLAVGGALAMLNDPRSLIVHGIYDRVRWPGTIVRRPAFTTTLFDRVQPCVQNLLTENAMSRITSWSRMGLRTKKRITSNTKPWLYTSRGSQYIGLDIGDVDPDGHNLFHIQKSVYTKIHQKLAMQDYLYNVPPFGVGQFALSTVSDEESTSVRTISEITVSNYGIADQDGQDLSDNSRVNHGNRHRHNDRFNPLILGNGRGPRLFNLLWTLSSHLGWNIEEGQEGPSIMVDRRILIASQWVANSLVMLPMLHTLLARALNRITPRPIDYHLEGFPYDIENEMRYLSSSECAVAAIGVCLIWLSLGRLVERRVGRTYERAMREHTAKENDYSLIGRVTSNIVLHCQRQLDLFCPIFLQRRVFLARWNRQTHGDIHRHIAAYRGMDQREHRSILESTAIRGTLTFGASIRVGGPPATSEVSSYQKVFSGLLVALGSFSATSPHFYLNLLSVLCCSIGLGMSMSLQSMEAGRGTREDCRPNCRSIFSAFSLNTVIVAFFMIGHLVGSSGGVLFLAEFAVTSVSLVLGGAGTISASAMESWGCFFCLSSTAFWGYLFARVALVDGMRQKRRGASSVFLCASLATLLGMWMISCLLWNWEVPPQAMIVHVALKQGGHRLKTFQQLQ